MAMLSIRGFVIGNEFAKNSAVIPKSPIAAIRIAESTAAAYARCSSGAVCSGVSSSSSEKCVGWAGAISISIR